MAGHLGSGRRRCAASVIALTAAAVLGSSALGAYWTPTQTLRPAPSANEMRPEAITASGPDVAAGWHEMVGGVEQMWVRESTNSGGAWAPRVRLVGDPSLAARDLSLDSGAGSHWAAWSEKRPIAGHPNQAVIIAAVKPYGSGLWQNLPVSAPGDATRSPTVAATPSRVFVIYQAKVGGVMRALIQDTRTDAVTFGTPIDLGAAPRSRGAPHVDATPGQVTAAWSDGHIRLQRGLIGSAPGYAVAWQPLQDLGIGNAPLVLAGSSRLVVFFHRLGDVWMRMSGNGGLSFGPPQKLLDGDPAMFNVYFADSAAITGLKIVLTATAGGDSFGSGLRLTTNNGGGSWTTENSNPNFADSRQVAFTSVGGTPKLAEVWLADLFANNNRIVFHRQQ
jgi:hypothetical protein